MTKKQEEEREFGFAIKQEEVGKQEPRKAHLGLRDFIPEKRIMDNAARRTKTENCEKCGGEREVMLVLTTSCEREIRLVFWICDCRVAISHSSQQRAQRGQRGSFEQRVDDILSSENSPQKMTKDKRGNVVEFVGSDGIQQSNQSQSPLFQVSSFESGKVTEGENNDLKKVVGGDSFSELSLKELLQLKKKKKNAVLSDKKQPSVSVSLLDKKLSLSEKNVTVSKDAKGLDNQSKKDDGQTKMMDEDYKKGVMYGIEWHLIDTSERKTENNDTSHEKDLLAQYLAENPGEEYLLQPATALKDSFHLEKNHQEEVWEENPEKTFLAFQALVNHPETWNSVVAYGGAPLWVTHTPPEILCQECGKPLHGPREIEEAFLAMVLPYLGTILESALRIDWSCIYVFECPSCDHFFTYIQSI